MTTHTYLAVVNLRDGEYVLKVGRTGTLESRSKSLVKDARGHGLDAVWAEMVYVIPKDVEDELLGLASPIIGREWFAASEFETFEVEFASRDATPCFPTGGQYGEHPRFTSNKAFLSFGYDRVIEFFIARGDVDKRQVGGPNFGKEYSRFDVATPPPDNRTWDFEGWDDPEEIVDEGLPW